MSQINEWADAIKIYEGWKPDSRSWRNHNPGNLRFAHQRGTMGPDQDGYAIFSSHEQGLTALRVLLRNAASGASLIYRGDMTLLEFFAHYAPSADRNNPAAYAQFVATHLKLPILTPISTLL